MKDEAEPVVMTGQAAEAYVLDVLRKRGPLTTMQIEQLAREEHKRCPDQTVLFLTMMKKKGMIQGVVSMEKRGWLWSLP